MDRIGRKGLSIDKGQRVAVIQCTHVRGRAFTSAAQQPDTRDPDLFEWIIHGDCWSASLHVHEDLAEHLPAFEPFQPGLDLVEGDHGVDHGLR